MSYAAESGSSTVTRWRNGEAPRVQKPSAEDSASRLTVTGSSGGRADGRAQDYDRRWRRYIAGSVRETLRRGGIGPGERVLDLGCGTGAPLMALRGASPATQAFGADLSLAMLRVGREKLGSAVPLVGCDAERLPFAPSAFDLVVSTSAFHFWTRPDVALGEMARVLRPSGRLVLTDWCADYLTIRILDLAHRLVDRGYRPAYSSRACDVLLARAGFVNRRIDRYKIDSFWGLMTAVAARD
jgi:SAM-dependent methyltransferase